MAAAGIASIPAFSTSPGTAVSGLGCARRIGRRPRMRLNTLFVGPCYFLRVCG